MTTPETCTCGRPMRTMKTPTALGAFSYCPHCDKPCGCDDGCPRCVLGRTERRP